MGGEIVDRDLNRTPILKHPQMLYQKLGLQSIRVVEIDFSPLFEGEMTAVLVIGIVLNIGDFITSNPIQDSLRDRCLARTRASGHTDDNGFPYAMFHSIVLLTLNRQAGH
jgi:hypothetical protein